MQCTQNNSAFMDSTICNKGANKVQERKHANFIAVAMFREGNRTEEGGMWAWEETIFLMFC